MEDVRDALRRCRGKWQRRIRRLAVGSASSSGRACRAAYVRGSTPTSWTRRPRSSTSTLSSPSSGHALERRDLLHVDRLRERIAAVREVVVAEHDEAGAELGEQALELREPRRPRHEVARDADEVRRPLRDPGDRLLARHAGRATGAEVEVGEVRDAEAVELGRHAVELDLEHPLPQPARLEPAPGQRRERSSGEPATRSQVRLRACRSPERPTQRVA